MTGYDDGGFHPGDEVTRGQMARIISALMDLDYDYYINAHPFTDMNGHWAEKYAAACYANGIIAGRTTTTYDPEAAAMLMRALGYILDLGKQHYNGELKLNKYSEDDFRRPARTWEYQSKEIGTYAKEELIKAEYSAKVTGKTLYELLTRSVTQDYALDVYVDGAWVEFNRDQLVRSNENSIRTTSKIYDPTSKAKTYGWDITGSGIIRIIEKNDLN